MSLYDGVEPASVCPPITLLNTNISETSGPITIKFYLKHHWVEESLHTVLGLMVSLTTDSSYRVILFYLLLPLHFLLDLLHSCR